MFKPKQVAPFFSMDVNKFSDMLKDIHLVYPFNQTPMGSILIQQKDFSAIEVYRNTLLLFGNKKQALPYFKNHIDETKEIEKQPDWIYLIKNRRSTIHD